MFVGVDSPLPVEECVELLTWSGELDMKIASAQRVDDVFEAGAAGLRFEYRGAPPRALPQRAGLIYFQVSRESQQQEWAQVQRSLTLAIRLNQNRVVGTIQGQRVLTIRSGGQNTTMRFTLYLVPFER
jgi:predicted component of type VI protein secretion system